MKKIILLSDLWGAEKAQWSFHYKRLLEKHFVVRFYDCRELAMIPATGLPEESLHAQFVNGGIDRAVERLLQKETEAFAVLSVSVGGSIAWKTCLSGFKAQHLFALSSSRLRYETEKPALECTLFYGDKDLFRPDTKWFDQMSLKEHLFEDEGHGLYAKKKIADDICKCIIEHIRSEPLEK